MQIIEIDFDADVDTDTDSNVYIYTCIARWGVVESVSCPCLVWDAVRESSWVAGLCGKSCSWCCSALGDPKVPRGLPYREVSVD